MKYIILVLAVVTISGCTVLKASPADNAGFVPKPELLAEKRERAPFNAYWVFNPDEYDKLRRDYAKVYIAPVDTSVVRAIYKSATGSEETKTMRIEEAEELANYFRERIKLNLKDSKSTNGRKMEVTEQPGPKTLSLKLALVQVVPTNPGVNLIGTAAGFFVPGGGLIKLVGEGSVAMEGYVAEESASLSLYEEFKDREGQKTSPFSLKDYQKYAHIRESIDEWAQQISLLLTTPSEYMVDDSSVISLNPL